VAVALEVREEGGANVVGGLHDGYLGLLCTRTKGWRRLRPMIAGSSPAPRGETSLLRPA
jgi:hypothetical protein